MKQHVKMFNEVLLRQEWADVNLELAELDEFIAGAYEKKDELLGKMKMINEKLFKLNYDRQIQNQD